MHHTKKHRNYQAYQFAHKMRLVDQRLTNVAGIIKANLSSKFKGNEDFKISERICKTQLLRIVRCLCYILNIKSISFYLSGFVLLAGNYIS